MGNDIRARDKGNTKTAKSENPCCFLKTGCERWSPLAWGMLVSVIAFTPCLIICCGIGMVRSPGIFAQQTCCGFAGITGIAYFHCSMEKSPQRFLIGRAYDFHGLKVDLF